jgi:internalin A
MIKNIDSIKRMTRLTKLNLAINKIQDLNDALVNLVNVEELNLEENQIKNISTISNLKSVQSINLNDNEISDLDQFVFSALKHLNFISLSNNRISKLQASQFFYPVGFIELNNNLIENVDFLCKMKSYIYDIQLTNNKIQNIDSLSCLQMINTLKLSFNSISSIQVFENIPSFNFRFLYLKNNRISSIDSLKKLTRMHMLDLSYNQIEDIGALKDLVKLEYLNLNGNRVKSISQLDNKIILNQLVLGSNQIKDISFLQNLEELTILDFSHNQVEFFFPIVIKKTKLRTLKMSLNNLTFNSNETFKNDLTQLELVWINKNMIKMFDTTINMQKSEKSYKGIQYFKSFFIITEDEPGYLDCFSTISFLSRRIHLNLFFYEQIDIFIEKCRYLDLENPIYPMVS